MAFYIYGIKSRGCDRVYVGQAEDIAVRLLQHNGGYVSSTKADRPWAVIAQEAVETRSQARWLERQLKKSRGKRERWLRRHAI